MKGLSLGLGAIACSNYSTWKADIGGCKFETSLNYTVRLKKAKINKKAGVVVHSCNLSTQEAEAEMTVNLRTIRST